MDETDFLDEVILPVDHANVIRDDEIGAILRGVSPKRTNLCGLGQLPFWYRHPHAGHLGQKRRPR